MEDKKVKTCHLITSPFPQGGGLGGRPDLQEGLRESHTALVETLDATHALLLVLAINVDTPTRYRYLSMYLPVI